MQISVSNQSRDSLNRISLTGDFADQLNAIMLASKRNSFNLNSDTTHQASSANHHRLSDLKEVNEAPYLVSQSHTPSHSHNMSPPLNQQAQRGRNMQANKANLKPVSH
jgi:hypothetical protein